MPEGEDGELRTEGTAERVGKEGHPKDEEGHEGHGGQDMGWGGVVFMGGGVLRGR